MSGIVYVLSHKAMPNLLKIGYTDRTMKERLRELHSTGVPGTFNVELYFFVEDAYVYESILHEALRSYRYKKEFFQIDISEVIAVVQEINRNQSFDIRQFYGDSKELAKVVNYNNAIDQDKLNEARVVAERNAKLSKLNYAELHGMYLKTLDSSNYSNIWEMEKERKIIKPLLNAAKERAYEEKKKEAEHSMKVFNTYKSEFLKVTSELNRLIDKYKPFKFTFGMLGYVVEDGLAVGGHLSEDQFRTIESFVKIHREISVLKFMPSLKSIEGYLDGEKVDYLFVDGRVNEMQPILCGVINHYHYSFLKKPLK